MAKQNCRCVLFSSSSVTKNVFYNGGRHYTQTLLTENMYINERKRQLYTLINGFILTDDLKRFISLFTSQLRAIISDHLNKASDLSITFLNRFLKSKKGIIVSKWQKKKIIIIQK